MCTSPGMTMTGSGPYTHRPAPGLHPYAVPPTETDAVTQKCPKDDRSLQPDHPALAEEFPIARFHHQQVGSCGKLMQVDDRAIGQP